MNCVLTFNWHIICVILIVLEHLESSVSQCSLSIINEISLKRSWKAWTDLMGLGSLWDSGLKCKKWNRWQRPQRIWSSLEGSGQSEDPGINQLVAWDRILSTHHWHIFAFFACLCCIVLSNAFLLDLALPKLSVSQSFSIQLMYCRSRGSWGQSQLTLVTSWAGHRSITALKLLSIIHKHLYKSTWAVFSFQSFSLFSFSFLTGKCSAYN